MLSFCCVHSWLSTNQISIGSSGKWCLEYSNYWVSECWELIPLQYLQYDNGSWSLKFGEAAFFILSLENVVFEHFEQKDRTRHHSRYIIYTAYCVLYTIIQSNFSYGYVLRRRSKFLLQFSKCYTGTSRVPCREKVSIVWTCILHRLIKSVFHNNGLHVSTMEVYNVTNVNMHYP